jgi:uncharacterized membrane protein YagU involved in acid resistance
MKSKCLIRDIAMGLVAGAVATFVMDQVSTWDYTLEDPKVKEAEEKMRGGEYPPEVLAKRVAEATTGSVPNKEAIEKLAMGIHWGYGILWGGLFGVLRNRVPVIGSAAGLTYGTGLWLIGDELMMPLLKLSPPSSDFPWQNHTRAFTNHVAYGTTLWVTMEALSRLADSVTS